MTATQQVAHTSGPWERRSIPGHLFDLHNAAGETVLKIRSGMMPTLADARLLEVAPELLSLLHGVIDQQESDGYVGVQLIADIRAAVAKAEGARS